VPTYLEVTDLKELLSYDGNPIGTAASLPDPELEERILAAEQQIDAKLTVAGYTVPLLTPEGAVPPLISELTGAIAAYFADIQYRRNVPHDGNDNAPVILRYKWATGILSQLGTRLLVVPGVEQDPAKRGQGGQVVEVIEPYAGRLFGPDIADVGPYRPADPWWW
jgi:hypothetical protein